MAIKLKLGGLSSKWWQKAGVRFKAGLQKFGAATAAIGLGPKNVARLGSMKLQGIAAKEFSEVIKTFNEAENARLTGELATRVLESKVLQAEAEAHTAQVTSMQAELLLRRQLQELGLTLAVDKTGRLSIMELPNAAVKLSEALVIAATDQASKSKR